MFEYKNMSGYTEKIVSSS